MSTTRAALTHTQPRREVHARTESPGPERQTRAGRSGLDRYFRRDDTAIARLVRRTAPRRGSAYATSAAKRGLDLVVGLPLAVTALPVILLLALINSILNPGHAPFFTQNRVGSSERRLRIVKLRSMRHPGRGQEPVIGPFARFLRKHYLDELPQMFQVLAGELSLVGIRVLPIEVHALLARTWSARRYDAWSRVYSSAPLGLTGVHQVSRGHGKEDTARFHRDLFYARSASLGLDLYLLWRTIRRAGR